MSAADAPRHHPDHPLGLDPLSPSPQTGRPYLSIVLVRVLQRVAGHLRELEPGDLIVIKRHRPGRSPVDAEYTVTVKTHQ